MGLDMADGRKKGRAGISIIAVIVLLICLLIIYKTNEYNRKLEGLESELASVNSRIDDAEAMTENIREEIKYRETDDYIEDQAREQLGLRYPDEIILRPESSDSSN